MRKVSGVQIFTITWGFRTLKLLAYYSVCFTALGLHLPSINSTLNPKPLGKKTMPPAPAVAQC